MMMKVERSQKQTSKGVCAWKNHTALMEQYNGNKEKVEWLKQSKRAQGLWRWHPDFPLDESES